MFTKNRYWQTSFLCELNSKCVLKSFPFAYRPSAMINRQWLELPMSRTKFHGHKDVRAIEVRLYNGFFGSLKRFSLIFVYLFCYLWNNLHITKTRLYNFDLLKPHFYIVKLGFTGVYIILFIFARNIYCWYSLEPPRGSFIRIFMEHIFKAMVQSFFMRTMKTLSRLCGCIGWLESLLGPHLRRYVLQLNKYDTSIHYKNKPI